MRHERRSAVARAPRVAPGGTRRPQGAPGKQGLYDPWYEHDACGVGFVVDIKGRKSHRILEQGIELLRNLEHRGACGCETNTGDAHSPDSRELPPVRWSTRPRTLPSSSPRRRAASVAASAAVRTVLRSQRAMGHSGERPPRAVLAGPTNQ